MRAPTVRIAPCAQADRRRLLRLARRVFGDGPGWNDGYVLDVAVDDEVVAQVGPGAILGERALLEGGVRTATLRAVTACRVVVFSGFALDSDTLAALADTRRREER